MKAFALAVVVLCLPIAAQAADLGGRWSGTFIITRPDGDRKDDTALLVLVQNGAELTGTAGPNEEKQWPIQNGRVEGDRVTFDVSAEGHLLNFTLTFVDGHLRGEAKGEPGSELPSATLDLVRTESEKTLKQTIGALDTAVFDAYNTCDLVAFASYFADDLEFYHDKAGVTRTRQETVDAVKNNICGKVRRELVPGTLEVYPIPGYGAVEVGVHRFYPVGGGSNAAPTGEAKFLHIWQNKDGAWKITRVVSYAHEAIQK